MAVDERLRRVVASVLGVRAEGLSDSDSPETLSAWDSVAHIQLVIAIEAEFGIEFSPEEIGELSSLGGFRERIEARAHER